MKKYILPVIVGILVAAAIITARQVGYKTGYQKGKELGFKEGKLSVYYDFKSHVVGNMQVIASDSLSRYEVAIQTSKMPVFVTLQSCIKLNVGQPLYIVIWK